MFIQSTVISIYYLIVVRAAAVGADADPGAAGAEYDVDIIQNIHRGNTIREELEQFYNNHQISTDVKGILNTSVETWLSGRDTSPGCCVITLTSQWIESVPQAVSFSCSKYRTTSWVTYDSCGILWLSRCTDHHTGRVSSMSTCYGRTYHAVNVKQTCPVDLQTCCEGQILWDPDRCIEMDKLREYLDIALAAATNSGDEL